MTIGQFRHIHLALLVGISLIIPFLLAYSLYIDLSETTLLSSDMSVEDADDEDLSTCEYEFNILIPQLFSNPLLIGTHFGALPCPFSTPVTSPTQITPVLRC